MANKEEVLPVLEEYLERLEVGKPMQPAFEDEYRGYCDINIYNEIPSFYEAGEIIPVSISKVLNCGDIYYSIIEFKSDACPINTLSITTYFEKFTDILTVGWSVDLNHCTISEDYGFGKFRKKIEGILGKPPTMYNVVEREEVFNKYSAAAEKLVGCVTLSNKEILEVLEDVAGIKVTATPLTLNYSYIAGLLYSLGIKCLAAEVNSYDI